MSIEKRTFIRFSLDIPVCYFPRTDYFVEANVRQVSIGGCLLETSNEILIGDEFRIEFHLPNKNRLPLKAKAIYKFSGDVIGVKFSDICKFEQELLSQVITATLEKDGLPLLVDPFMEPRRPIHSVNTEQNIETQHKIEKDDLVNEVIAS